MLHMMYGDLSEGEGILTSGAYLGQQDQWMNAIAKWCAALDDAGVKTFHATAFFSARGEFDDDRWRYNHPEKGMIPGGELHNTFAERFTSIPMSCGLLGFSYSIYLEPFTEILAPLLAKAERKHRQGHPRTQAIMSSLASAGKWLTETAGYRERGSIQVIYEHENGAGKFVDFFNESLARQERWTYCFKSFTTEGKWLVPLQMADLLAHESWRRTKQVRDNPSAKLRKSFERMIGDGKISLQLHDREVSQKDAAAVTGLLAKYPNGLFPPDTLFEAITAPEYEKPAEE